MDSEWKSKEIIYEPVYTIGHAAEKLGVSVPTIRMYEQAGLILPFRTKKNRRLYSRHDISHLKIIIELLRKHRLNLEGIKRISASLPCWIINRCPQRRHKNCEAYVDCTIPCWVLLESNCSKADRDCRSCEVYLSYPKFLKDPKLVYKTFE
jgi:hypothetical protein